jgi:hypothetical protein
MFKKWWNDVECVTTKKRQMVLAGVFVTLFPFIDDFHFERKDLNSHMYQL